MPQTRRRDCRGLRYLPRSGRMIEFSGAFRAQPSIGGHRAISAVLSFYTMQIARPAAAVTRRRPDAVGPVQGQLQCHGHPLPGPEFGIVRAVIRGAEPFPGAPRASCQGDDHHDPIDAGRIGIAVRVQCMATSPWSVCTPPGHQSAPPWCDKCGPLTWCDKCGPLPWCDKCGPLPWCDKCGPLPWCDKCGPLPWCDKRGPPPWCDKRGPLPWCDKCGPPGQPPEEHAKAPPADHEMRAGDAGLAPRPVP
jgi:hypothetical protein